MYMYIACARISIWVTTAAWMMFANARSNVRRAWRIMRYLGGLRVVFSSGSLQHSLIVLSLRQCLHVLSAGTHKANPLRTTLHPFCTCGRTLVVVCGTITSDLNPELWFCGGRRFYDYNSPQFEEQVQKIIRRRETLLTRQKSGNYQLTCYG
jgi:hypothetical protein